MNSITVLIKPCSSLCNAHCEYCFYKDLSNHRSIKSYGLMTQQQSTEIIKKAMAVPNVHEITFAFQGGEPLIAGIDYFRSFILTVNSLNKNKIINYTLQTNALLINRDFCRLFKDNHFLLGISIDGVRKTNNLVRFTKDMNGSFEEVYHKIKVIESYDIDFNITTVLSTALYKHAQEIYAFYKKNQWNHIQFIPCLSEIANNEGTNFSCTPDMFLEFYDSLFFYWFTDLKIGRYMSINLFDDIIRQFRGQQAIQCGMNGSCSHQCIIESNGNTYPCDFFVLDKYFTGNIKDISFIDILSSKVGKDFRDKPSRLSIVCDTCKFAKICNGGCKRQRHTYLSSETCALQHVYNLFYEHYQIIEHSLQQIGEVK